MAWLRGTIEEFKGGRPEYKAYRKIRTRADQVWQDLHFFQVPWALRAGYSEPDLAAGKQIEFEPDPDRPQVRRFRPKEPHRESRQMDRSPVEAPAFLNPYHFIPLAPPDPSVLREADTVLRGNLHNRFEGYSGRIVCRLETEGPVVVGAERRPGEKASNAPAEVWPCGIPDPAAPDDPYRRTPMIPGSTLRGLISALVEAASGSTLRVLGDREFTRREAMDEALSAVGLLVEEGGRLRLQPLTVSIREMNRFDSGPPKEHCRVLLNAYQGRGTKEYSPGTFLDRTKPLSWSSTHQERWYMDLHKARWHWKQRGDRQIRIGLMAEEDPLTEERWSALPASEKSRYSPGLLLVLGLEDGKADQLPPDKKHEYFIPFVDRKGGSALLDIPDAVLEEFVYLARDASLIQRGERGPRLPFLHAGRAREKDEVRPRAGDLVYFDSRDGQVTRLSYSSLWRRRIPGSVHTAVEKGGSIHLVPLQENRTQLTLAEELFGFVEHQGPRALAGRLRFSHALAEGEPQAGDWYDPAVLLKILNSPKPPCPALYFGHHDLAAKRDLDLTRHAPQGRKVYLHHREADVRARRYQTADDSDKMHQKTRVRPIKSRTGFLFHVDFDNLTGQELGYLLYALRPASGFRHKVGMGRPLGLGRVRIDPLALCFIDRKDGYSAGSLFASKYHWTEILSARDEWERLSESARRRYRHETAPVTGTDVSRRASPAFATLCQQAREATPEKVRWAIELTGDPRAVEVEVTYPVLAGQPSEGEHFKWFVENDKSRGGRQRLKAIQPGEGLPSLKRHRPPGRNA